MFAAGAIHHVNMHHAKASCKHRSCRSCRRCCGGCHCARRNMAVSHPSSFCPFFWGFPTGGLQQQRGRAVKFLGRGTSSCPGRQELHAFFAATHLCRRGLHRWLTINWRPWTPTSLGTGNGSIHCCRCTGGACHVGLVSLLSLIRESRTARADHGIRGHRRLRRVRSRALKRSHGGCMVSKVNVGVDDDASVTDWRLGLTRGRRIPSCANPLRLFWQRQCVHPWRWVPFLLLQPFNICLANRIECCTSDATKRLALRSPSEEFYTKPEEDVKAPLHLWCLLGQGGHGKAL
mmetsp:Transcript_51862/g.168585  ORF Transcript_51862/g.168585 Transcript_51862/m.168585 type:complete len:290 (-) Transcript_51862:470-1339(-)